MNHIKKIPFITYAAPTEKQGNVRDNCVYPSLQKKALHSTCVYRRWERTLSYMGYMSMCRCEGKKPWWITVLVKVAYYASSSARNFAKLC